MKIDAIVLAAGYSSRFKGFKLTKTIFNNLTIIENCINKFTNICNKIIVVTGYKNNLIVNTLSKNSNINFVYNKNFDKGMFSSIQIGVKNSSSDKIFITPGDLPFFSSETCKRMLLYEGKFIIPSYKNRCGHPILIDSSVKKEIINESSSSNLKNIRNRLGYKIVEVEDKGILIDIDTKSDYEKNIDIL